MNQFKKSAQSVGIVTSSLCEDFGEQIPAIGELKHPNQFVPDLSRLSTLQQEQLNVLINSFMDIFRDISDHTTLCTHHKIYYTSETSCVAFIPTKSGEKEPG